MQILSSCGLLSHLLFSKGSSWLPNLNFVICIDSHFVNKRRKISIYRLELFILIINKHIKLIIIYIIYK